MRNAGAQRRAIGRCRRGEIMSAFFVVGAEFAADGEFYDCRFFC
jgi:hypothetical protein